MVDENLLPGLWNTEASLQAIARRLDITTMELRTLASRLRLPITARTGLFHAPQEDVAEFVADWNTAMPNRQLEAKYHLRPSQWRGARRRLRLEPRPYILSPSQFEQVRAAFSNGSPALSSVAKRLGITASDLREALTAIDFPWTPERSKPEKAAVGYPVVTQPYAFASTEDAQLAVSLWGRVPRAAIAGVLGLSMLEFRAAVSETYAMLAECPVPHPAGGRNLLLFPRSAYVNDQPAYSPLDPTPLEIAPPIIYEAARLTPRPVWEATWTLSSIAEVFGYPVPAVTASARLLGKRHVVFTGPLLIALLALIQDRVRSRPRCGRRLPSVLARLRARGGRLRRGAVKRPRPLHALFQTAHVISASPTVCAAPASRVTANRVVEPVLAYQVAEMPSSNPGRLRYIVRIQVDVLRTLSRLRPRAARVVGAVIPAPICVVLAVLR